MGPWQKLIAKYKTILTILGGTFLSILLLQIIPSHSAKNSENEFSRGVAVMSATPTQQTPSIILYGRIESPDISKLSAAIKADIKEVQANEGQTVKKEALLLSLDPREVTFSLAERTAKAQELQAMIATEKENYNNDQLALAHEKQLVELLEKALERQAKIKAKGLGSAQRLDEAQQALSQQKLSYVARQRAITTHEHRLKQLEAQLASAKAQVAQAELDVSRTQIKAPFDGRIVKVNVSVGDRVQVGDDLISIVDSSSLEVRSQIPANYLADIKKIMQHVDKQTPLTAHSDVDDHRIQLSFLRLASEVSIGQGGVDAIFSIDNNKSVQLTLGRTIQLWLDLPPMNNVIAIPEQALYPGNQIYLYQNHYATPFTVETMGMTQTDKQHKYILIQSSSLPTTAEIIITRIPDITTKIRLHKLTTKSTDDGNSP